MERRIERALISVSDKTGIADFARRLAALGIEILSTGGTRRELERAGISAGEVSEHTGFPEILDGRVKTLHPLVHGGILARRDDPAHAAAMREHGILPIDLVVVNLYPFERTVARAGVAHEAAIEEIDIGGPALIRAAAKNHDSVAVVTDPADYERVLVALEERGVLGAELRRELARAAFRRTARYDAAIAAWLERAAEEEEDAPFPEEVLLAGARVMDLRYGENPHQRAALYRGAPVGEASVVGAEVLGGKPLSFNNLLDLDAALALAKELADPFACVVKHANPCGAAAAATIAAALEGAWAGDPLSAFGSVVALNRPLDLAAAEFLVSENRFVEAVIAPAFEPEALEGLTTRPRWGKSVRLVACGPIGPERRAARAREVRAVLGGFLLQTRDLAGARAEDLSFATNAQPSAADVEALLFAERVAKHVRSNAIVLAVGRRVVGVGAGQMSRVDAVRMAVQKAGDRARGSVLASDAFFPFPDGVEAAMAAGVRAILQPGGSVRDADVIAACDRGGVPMVFTGQRHFRH
jgi:phosphoribosylaminoimidazolecarboxamide formyltransferase/IMP cyclohydrolase